jgi:hypothetical protein
MKLEIRSPEMGNINPVPAAARDPRMKNGNSGLFRATRRNKEVSAGNDFKDNFLAKEVFFPCASVVLLDSRSS